MENPKYWYCKVTVKGVKTEYSYISDEGELQIGSFVQIPFGSGNTLRIGVVKDCQSYDSSNVPYPVRFTKHISRRATMEEYVADKPVGGNDDGPDNKFIEVNDYIAYGNWNNVLLWACQNEDTDDMEVAAKVLECYEKCTKQNMPVAFLNLGRLYYIGRFVEQDYKKAFDLYKVAADAGLPRALCNCGYCYYYGRHQEIDYAEAYRYFDLGVQLGNDANCLYKLGDMYLNGYAVKKNPLFAFKLYDRALDVCHESKDAEPCIADVQLRVGRCLLYGIGIHQDAEAAHAMLSFALLNYYKRRRSDIEVQERITTTKRLIRKAQKYLDAGITGKE